MQGRFVEQGSPCPVGNCFSSFGVGTGASGATGSSRPSSACGCGPALTSEPSPDFPPTSLTFNFHWRRVLPARGPGPIRASVGPALQCERDRCCNTMLWSAVAATFVLAGESQPEKILLGSSSPFDIPSKSPKCYPLIPPIPPPSALSTVPPRVTRWLILGS